MDNKTPLAISSST